MPACQNTNKQIGVPLEPGVCGNGAGWYTKVCMKNTRKHKILLRHTVRRIVSAFPQVRQIVLFGSYASGVPTRYSDLDFLVVMPTRKRWSDRVRALQALFPERSLPMDFVVRTPGEIRERLTSYFCPFTREVLEKGKVLYEASPRRS